MTNKQFLFFPQGVASNVSTLNRQLPQKLKLPCLSSINCLFSKDFGIFSSANKIRPHTSSQILPVTLSFSSFLSTPEKYKAKLLGIMSPSWLSRTVL